jgi:hypothetical protein
MKTYAVTVNGKKYDVRASTIGAAAKRAIDAWMTKHPQHNGNVEVSARIDPKPAIVEVG